MRSYTDVEAFRLIESLHTLFSMACSIRLDVHGQWYMKTGLEIGGDGMLASATGRGTTPSAAIHNTLRLLIELPQDRYIVVKANTPEERCYQWNGVAFTLLPKRTGVKV